MTEHATFWNNKHPLSATSEEMFAKYVPGSGNCDFIAGELLRAASKISYDWYNNGWGCNNWSGAVCYLKEYAVEMLKLDADTAKKLNASLDYVYDYSHGEPASFLNYNSTPCRHVTQITEIVVQGILDNPALCETKNTVDMWDLSEEDYIPWRMTSSVQTWQKSIS